MSAFLASFIQYVVIMIILAFVGVLGAKAGIALRKRKDAKEAAVATEVTEDSAS